MTVVHGDPWIQEERTRVVAAQVLRLRWTWRNGRLAANPKVVDLRVAGWSACLAVPKNGEPEGGGVVPMLGGPAEVSCEPSRTERVRDQNGKMELAEYV